MVVEGSNKKLAIECDGERWHTADELENDLRRQAILERLGWVFVRIRGSLFFRDPDAAMAEVYAKLTELGIEALGSIGGSTEPTGSALVDEIKRAAELIRASWPTQKTALPADDDPAPIFPDSPAPSSPRPTELNLKLPHHRELPYVAPPKKNTDTVGVILSDVENCILSLLRSPKRLETEALILTTVRTLNIEIDGLRIVETALGALLLKRQITRSATHVGIVETY
jgi:hypothetical protein